MEFFEKAKIFTTCIIQPQVLGLTHAFIIGLTGRFLSGSDNLDIFPLQRAALMGELLYVLFPELQPISNELNEREDQCIELTGMHKSDYFNMILVTLYFYTLIDMGTFDAMWHANIDYSDFTPAAFVP